MRQQQNKANRNYYDKNKDKIIEKKKLKYENKKNDPEFKDKQKQKSKEYYEKNKELIKSKNLDHYYMKFKNNVEFPKLEIIS